MSVTIDVGSTVASNTIGCKVYAFAFANVSFDIKTQSNIDAFREFVVDNKGAANYTGILQLTSNVTAYDYHSGKGAEEFKGTLTKAFAGLDSSDQNIIQPDGDDDYYNHVYTAIQDGINASLWTFGKLSTNTIYYMVVSTTTNNVSGNEARKRWLFNGSQSYITTADGKINFGQNVEALTDNAILSSVESFPSGGYVSTRRGSARSALYEFMVFKTGGDSPITGFSIHNFFDQWQQWHNYNYEIRVLKGKFDLFDTALGNPGNAIHTSMFDTYPNYMSVINKFTLLHTVNSVKPSITYDIATNTATVP